MYCDYLFLSVYMFICDYLFLLSACLCVLLFYLFVFYIPCVCFYSSGMIYWSSLCLCLLNCLCVCLYVFARYVLHHPIAPAVHCLSCVAHTSVSSNVSIDTLWDLHPRRLSEAGLRRLSGIHTFISRVWCLLCI